MYFSTAALVAPIIIDNLLKPIPINEKRSIRGLDWFNEIRRIEKRNYL
jgi:hypothetical protein